MAPRPWSLREPCIPSDLPLVTSAFEFGQPRVEPGDCSLRGHQLCFQPTQALFDGSLTRWLVHVRHRPCVLTFRRLSRSTTLEPKPRQDPLSFVGCERRAVESARPLEHLLGRKDHAEHLDNMLTGGVLSDPTHRLLHLG